MLSRRQALFLGGAATLQCAEPDPLNRLADAYIELVLAVGVHEPDYVDAFYGPEALKAKVGKEKLDLASIKQRASELSTKLQQTSIGGKPELVQLRKRYLQKQTQSLAKRVELLQGAKFSFDEESSALYDAVAPQLGAAAFAQPLKTLDELVPGKGPLGERYAEWKKNFAIPSERLDKVFRLAIEEARARTKKYIALPPEENFVVEYVKNQVWSAYNWYKGGTKSLIQVNTDLPLDIGYAITLGCHEGYPGHHVYNALLEDRLVRGMGWKEFTIYALYSPQSLIAEGSANYGVSLAFPDAERVDFYQSELFPAAGLSGKQALQYHHVTKAAEKLSHAGNQAARQYLDGKFSKQQCKEWLMQYGLQTEARAEQRVRFIEKNRAYVINYNLGEDLIAAFIDKQTGARASTAKRWAEFEKLLSSPRLPSGLT
jgi:hypothetical protein